MSRTDMPEKVASTDELGLLVKYADKVRALLFGLRDSDPGCTLDTRWGS